MKIKLSNYIQEYKNKPKEVMLFVRNMNCFNKLDFLTDQQWIDICDYYINETEKSVGKSNGIISVKNGTSIRRIITSYYNSTKDICSSKENMIKFVEWRILNSKVSNVSNEFIFNLFNGNQEMVNYYREYKKSNRNSQYDPNYISKRDGISLEDAKKQIERFKSNKATTKENFIKKHGKEKGEEMWKRHCTISRHSENIYIEKFGEKEGKKKWQEYLDALKKENKRCIEYYTSRGYTKEDAKEEVSKYQKENSGTHIDYYRNLGYNENEIKEILLEINSKKDSASLNFYINKYGEELGEKKYLDNCIRMCNIGQASTLSGGISKISVELFKKLEIEYIPEFKLKNPNRKRIYSYDFKYKNKIIEFNGDYWHCNPIKYKPNDIVKGRKAKDKWKQDKEKVDFAISQGYEVLTIWEDEYKNNKEQTINKVKKFLEI